MPIDFTSIKITLVAPKIRCPYCNALQFMSRDSWRLTTVDEALLSIKCRRCQRVLPLSLLEENNKCL